MKTSTRTEIIEYLECFLDRWDAAQITGDIDELSMEYWRYLDDYDLPQWSADELLCDLLAGEF